VLISNQQVIDTIVTQQEKASTNCNMSGSYHSQSNQSSCGGSVRDENGVISTGGSRSREDEEYGDASSVKKMDVPADTTTYTEEQEQEQTNKVNSLCADFNYFMCCCVPTRVSGPGEVAGRFGRWFLGQSDQFISSIIGK